MLRKHSLALVITPTLIAGLYACEVEQTQEGELPEVSVEGGQMPKYDAEAPRVDVGTEERTVTVPTIEVQPPAEDEQDSEQADVSQEQRG
jgi:hypothetical protein